MVVYLLFRFIGILVHLAPINHFDNVKMNCVSGVLAILVTLIFFQSCIYNISDCSYDDGAKYSIRQLSWARDCQ